MIDIALTVNGRQVEARVEPRLSLADFLREHELLTGTHLGCEHGVCGACTVLIDGVAVRSCLMFAVQADGYAITTIEGLSPGPGELSILQDAFCETHGMQCGYCTCGMIMSALGLLRKNPKPTAEEIVQFMDGNVCRCGTYPRIVAAVSQAAKTMQEAAP